MEPCFYWWLLASELTAGGLKNEAMFLLMTAYFTVYSYGLKARAMFLLMTVCCTDCWPTWPSHWRCLYSWGFPWGRSVREKSTPSSTGPRPAAPALTSSKTSMTEWRWLCSGWVSCYSLTLGWDLFALITVLTFSLFSTSALSHSSESFMVFISYPMTATRIPCPEMSLFFLFVLAYMSPFSFHVV